MLFCQADNADWIEMHEEILVSWLYDWLPVRVFRLTGILYFLERQASNPTLFEQTGKRN